jgi:sialate O-acetylesterase
MKQLRTIFLVISLLFIIIGQAIADIKLPAVVGNNMVLQQNKPLKIWGWADPEESVKVQINKNRAKTKADKNGKWNVTLSEMKAGGPYKMIIEGNNSIILNNILIGEVWICSGQSNMEWRMRTSKDNVKEILAANFPNIRLFHVPRRFSGHPLDDVQARWKECDPVSVIGFSAVSYFFGRMLQKELDVPVGLIQTAWGGTKIEPWIPPEGYKLVPELNKILEEIETAELQYREEMGKSLNEIESWLPEAQKAYSQETEIPEMPEIATFPLEGRQKPTALYNGQIYALVPYSFRGAIWYQGESNLEDGINYYYLMNALIQGWRKVWGQGKFPFYYVQLAPYSYTFKDSGMTEPYRMPIIREAQRKALDIPNTGMVVTTDIGNLFNIHPVNKQEVGRRLSLWALANTYGKNDIVYSGPLYKSMQIKDNRIYIQFDYADNGLKSKDDKILNWFEIAGTDKKFVCAQARIRRNEVEVWSAEIDDPVAVRFGWHENANPNLVNKEGLPASPFNTGIK